MRYLLGWVVGGWLVVTQVQAALVHDPSLQWFTRESPHFIFHYHNGEEAITPKVAAMAERVHTRLSAWLPWSPSGKTEVIISDEMDFANGHATMFPARRMTIYVSAPAEINSLEDYDDWLEYVFSHEYLHILHLDKVNSLPAGLQNVFGRYPLLFPNALQPSWFIEGLATYVETDTQRGVGRGQSSYFDMLMRMEVANGVKPLRQINQPLSSWPIGYTPYLYGVHYYQFLRDKYGEASINKLVDNYSGNLIPFRINSTSERTFGKDLSPLWDEFDQYLHAKYDPQLTTIRTAGVQQGNKLTADGYYAGPIRVLADGRVYFIANRGDTHAGLYQLVKGQAAHKLRDVNPSTRLDVHSQQGILMMQPEVCHSAAIYYDLYRVSLEGSGLDRLTHCARYHEAAWTIDGEHIIAAQYIAGKSTLHQLNQQGELQQVLWEGQDTTQLSALSMRPDGTGLVASVWRPQTGWNLEAFDFALRQWRKLTHDTQVENHPAFSSDGQWLYYSAEVQGVYNIVRLNLASGQREQLTNVLGGAFYPSLQQNTLYYIGYDASGFDVYALDTAKPTVLAASKTEQFTAPMDAQTTSAVPLSAAEPYGSLSGMSPTWWFPHLVIDQQRVELGAVTSGHDALERHTYAVDLAYDAKNNWLVGGADYIYDRYWPVLQLSGLSRTYLYLDSNDEPLRVRRENIGIAQIILPYLTLEDSWTLRLAAIADQEKDIWLADGVTPYNDTRDNMGAVGITYRSTERYVKSISRNDGRDVRLVSEDSDALGSSDYTGKIYKIDWREFIALGGQHVLALRYVQGYGTDHPRPFRLGGIQSSTNALNYIFGGTADPIFNVRNYTLRGYKEGHTELEGRRMQLASGEYRFPLALIERGWMIPPLGIHQLHGTVFYESGAAWNGDSPTKHYNSAGAELNADVDLFFNVRMQTVLGVAHGFDRDLGVKQIYLRIGHNF